MQKRAIWQKVGHCVKGSSDKLYVVVVIEGPTLGEFEVVARWGKRRLTGPQQSKTYHECGSLTGALCEAEKLWKKKVDKGYVDIDAPGYDGPIYWDWLRGTDWYTAGAEGARIMRGSQPAMPAAKLKERTFVVVCVNAGGVEDRFVEGEQYAAEGHSDSEMLWVTDMRGKRDEWFMERFERLSV